MTQSNAKNSGLSRVAVGAFIALALAILWPALAANSQGKGSGTVPTLRPGSAPAGAKYFGLDQPGEWTYEATFDDSRVFYSPYSVNIRGLVGSSVTHGSRRMKTHSVTFSVKTLEPYKDPSIAVTLDDAGKLFWFAPSLCGSRLVVVRSNSGLSDGHPWTEKARDEDGQWKPLQPFSAELLALELHLTPCSKDNKPMDWVLGEILGMAPADGASPVSRYGWVSAPAADPLAVPAGTYSRVIYSRFPRGDGHYAPEHIVESWLAEDVGLIKYRVTEKGTPVYTLALKSVRKIE